MTWLNWIPLIGSMNREAETLREECQRLSTQVLLLQDRLDAAENDRSNLWDLVKESLRGEREALKSQINFAVQQRFGITPYPEATQLPESHGPASVDPVPRFQLPSEMIAAQRAKFQTEFLEEVNSRLKR